MNQAQQDLLTACMAVYGDSSDGIQRVQTEHRCKLAQFWQIQKGERVLEIGCGQGDTTVVLAQLVGEDGFVHGIDIASPDYGAPMTLGEAAAGLRASAIGSWIQLDFEIDVLGMEFPNQSFDTIVMSHCSWYFASREQLLQVLTKVRKWGKRLCFAEWDARIASIEQYSHLLAALIQAQYEAYKRVSQSNIRTLFAPGDLLEIAEAAGWSVNSEGTIYSPDLQDGGWEVDYTLQCYEEEMKAAIDIPAKLTALIASQIAMLTEAKRTHGIKPLSTFAFIAASE
ncbi:class I SAM-dependent methyltransferase [Paenibacillus radicis (ex Gao et al. 2016)]|uniref:SAM-dependent methyltransferase n=1 Tax=Paenibacillus radicis (ex Gao et al. 2016) TaxID=1737354 RepID=A0A917M0S4_9BACL|nr:class I SAM-dependent methyltransferase [Paenibacillus radicis (ex Gao et al. 2016)]GGG67884.1 SAM-dependent methyltransferase [Paenibacillus radicis (ex Gao et al. 2016)]